MTELVICFLYSLVSPHSPPVSFSPSPRDWVLWKGLGDTRISLGDFMGRVGDGLWHGYHLVNV